MSLLNKWFADRGYTIYMASPEVDSDRLRDVIDVGLRYQYQGKLAAFYLNPNCDPANDISTEEVKAKALKKYDARYQTYIEYSLLRQITLPATPVRARFVAGVKDDLAEVMVTSASFHGNSFLHHGLETVAYQEMSAVDFVKDYIEPLGGVFVGTCY